MESFTRSRPITIAKLKCGYELATTKYIKFDIIIRWCKSCKS